MSEHSGPCEIHCSIGEVKIGRSGSVLRATLGSCVGIAILWRVRGRTALAHCLLADAPAASCQITARYVSQAIPSLLRLVRAEPKDYPELEAIVVGGAQMLGKDSSSGTRSIGRMNGEAALRILAERGIRIVHRDLGGYLGRRIEVDCENYSYNVSPIDPRSEAA